MKKGLLGIEKDVGASAPLKRSVFLGRGSYAIAFGHTDASLGHSRRLTADGFKKQPRKTAQNHRGKSLFGFEMHPLLGILIVRFLGRRQTWFFVTVCVPKRAANSSGFVW